MEQSQHIIPLSVISLECEQKCFILYSNFWGIED